MSGIFPSNTELEAVLESNGSSQFAEIAQFLLNACSDWPTFNLKEPRDLILELAREVPGKLTQLNIERYSQSLPASGFENWPHKAGTCVAVLELFRLGSANDLLTLDGLVQRQWSKYRTEMVTGQ